MQDVSNHFFFFKSCLDVVCFALFASMKRNFHTQQWKPQKVELRKIVCTLQETLLCNQTLLLRSFESHHNLSRPTCSEKLLVLHSIFLAEDALVLLILADEAFLKMRAN